MDINFVHTTPEQQLNKLKNQNLIINDENIAKEILDIYGYYNVINSYKEPYIQKDGEKKSYKPDVSFEQIFSLFTFDHHLKEAILSSMLDIEELLRAALADIIAHSFGIDHTIYLNPRNYRNRRVSDPRFSLSSILNKMNTAIIHGDKNPIAYYKNTYNIVPPWILFKSVYLSTLVNFVRQLKKPEQTALIMKLYGVDRHTAEQEFMVHLLNDTLHICREYRNLTAHSGRIYNHRLDSSCRIPSDEQLDYLRIIYPFIDDLKSARDLSLLATLLRLFAYQQPFNIINAQLHEHIYQHCHQYPSDISCLETALGITIEM